MMIQTPRELARAVRDRFSSNRELHLLPWRQEEPETTLWWLTPSGENPAYGDGKFVFSLDKDSPRKALLGRCDDLLEVGTIFVGLNIEKGLGPAAGIAGPPRPKPSEMLGLSWVWHQLVGGDGPVQFARTLAALSRGVTTHLYVISATVRDADDSARSRPRDAVLFSCHASGITTLVGEFGDGVLDRDGVKTATTFESLADELRRVDDYHWVDLYAGTYISRGDVDLAHVEESVLSVL